MLLRRSVAPSRSGSVAVELAILLPLVMFCAVIGVDYARIFTRTMVLETASRNAAIWAAQDIDHANNKEAIKNVALKDLTDVSPTPVVTSEVYKGPDGWFYVKVTVTMPFDTVTEFPGVPKRSNLIRSTDMRVLPMQPKPGTF
jgi:Flp pilus assembly protein TadG